MFAPWKTTASSTRRAAMANCESLSAARESIALPRRLKAATSRFGSNLVTTAAKTLRWLGFALQTSCATMSEVGLKLERCTQQICEIRCHD